MIRKILNKLFRPRLLRDYICYLWEVWRVRINYRSNLRRLRNIVQDRKLKVVFLVNEMSKWKVQSLCDLMRESGRFDIVIALDLAWRYAQLPENERSSHLSRNRKFFECRGFNCVEAVSLPGKKFDLCALKPDIVFYQQPMNSEFEMGPEAVSKVALTCYVPYFVANYGAPDIECGRFFHRMLWRHFVVNERWAEFYRKTIPGFAMAGQIVGSGHTIMDEFYLKRGKVRDEGYVIYAPHWSFEHPNNQFSNEFSVGTFLETGSLILEFAIHHPDLKWVFKPHPLLYLTLIKSGVMSRAAVDAYFDTWRRIAIFHETPDYQEIFMASKVMITDSCSFTAEYPATGKPLIHLISKTAKRKTLGPNKRLYELFYRTHTKDELLRALDTIVLQGEDPLRDNAVTFTPCFETLVLSEDGQRISDIPPRRMSYSAQAPQSFRLGDILAAHEKIRKMPGGYTDMVDQATICWKLGIPINLVPGNRGNIKITTPEDICTLEALIKWQEEDRHV